MQVTDEGVPVGQIIDIVKTSIKSANVSTTDSQRDLLVDKVDLNLKAVATRSGGGGVDFRIPFIGMQVKIGTKLTREDTHTITISLAAPLRAERPELRDGDIESVFVDAVKTIRAVVAGAAGGDDPFMVGESTVEISFAVTREGTITLGVDGSLSQDLTHTLTLHLVPAKR